MCILILVWWFNNQLTILCDMLKQKYLWVIRDLNHKTDHLIEIKCPNISYGIFFAHFNTYLIHLVNCAYNVDFLFIFKSLLWCGTFIIGQKRQPKTNWVLVFMTIQVRNLEKTLRMLIRQYSEERRLLHEKHKCVVSELKADQQVHWCNNQILLMGLL